MSSEAGAAKSWAGTGTGTGTEVTLWTSRLASRLLQEVFSAVEPDSPKLSVTPQLLELHQVITLRKYQIRSSVITSPYAALKCQTHSDGAMPVSLMQGSA
jgi:hypothetical protein